jgi:hypothetical protein
MNLYSKSVLALCFTCHHYLNVTFKCTVALSAILISSASFAWWQETQNALPSPYDCTQVVLDDVDKALLTKKERIALLDDSLSTSIDNYSSCVNSVSQASGNAGSGGGSGVNADGDEGADGVDGSAENNTNSALDANGSENKDAEQLSTQVTGKPSAKSLRGIIPPKDNDKIICKLLFQEILITQDADMLKGLKQQYDNYQCGL